MTAPKTGAGDGSLLVRTARPSEAGAVVDLLQRNRAHVSGSRRRTVFVAFLADSFGPQPRTTVTVIERNGMLAGALLVVNGDLPRYYRELPRHHPVAALALVAHRARKLPARTVRRRRARRLVPVGDGRHPSSAPELADEPRLLQAPRPPSAPGPHASDHGLDIAFCVYLLIEEGHRGQGLSKVLLRATLGHLRAGDATRYDCNFVPQDAAAARLYLSMPFDIQRFPSGYFASIDLTAIEPRRLGS